MASKIGALIERAVANGAFVVVFFQMGDLVHGQGPGLAEAFAALAAFERLFFGMDVAVVP